MAGHQNYMNIVGAFSLLGTASIVSLLYLYNVVDISSAANWEEEYISYSISRLEKLRQYITTVAQDCCILTTA